MLKLPNCGWCGVAPFWNPPYIYIYIITIYPNQNIYIYTCKYILTVYRYQPDMHGWSQILMLKAARLCSLKPHETHSTWRVRHKDGHNWVVAAPLLSPHPNISQTEYPHQIMGFIPRLSYWWLDPTFSGDPFQPPMLIHVDPCWLQDRRQADQTLVHLRVWASTSAADVFLQEMGARTWYE